MESVIIRICDSQHHVTFYRFHQDVINVGRGYRNDIILTDPYCSPQHLQFVRYEDGWDVVDKGSLNGTWLKKIKKGQIRLQQYRLSPDDVLLVGKSQIQLMAPDVEVAPTRLYNNQDEHRGIMKPSLFMVIFLQCLFFLGVVGEIWANLSKEFSWGALLLPAFMTLIFLYIWAGGWALASRLFRQRSHLGGHLILSSVAGLAALQISQVSSYLGYWIQKMVVEGFVGIVLISVLNLYILAKHLQLASFLSTSRRYIVATSIVGLFFGLTLLAGVAYMDRWNPTPMAYTTLKPYRFLAKPSVSLENFMNDSLKVYDNFEDDESYKNKP